MLAKVFRRHVARKALSERRRSTGAGFTLFEVVVSMTILAVGIALAVSLISRSLNNIRTIESRARIVEHATSVMELTLLDDTISEPTSFEGDFPEDGTRWTMRIEEYIPDEPEFFDQIDTMSVRMLAYTVDMFRPSSRAVDFRLRTLKLVPRQ